ncbi:hypothetical protein MKW98_027121 [Papaver atlanticum]|uniref:Cytochrome P450 n=1 Tax=Papaver atlanticum TaxID=357466 RepID=A0AAD4XDV4_9MAGN|nr:hypothetical protein MKW98_027121 [Papaver atlanticum]
MDSHCRKLTEKCVESYSLVLVLFCLIMFTVWHMHYKKHVIVRWPVLGFLPSIIYNAHRIHDWTVDISKIFGATIIERGPFFGRLEIVYTCDPRNAKYILATNYCNFNDRQDYRDAFDILGDGLLTATSNFWTAQRRVARMTFTSKIVRGIIAHKGTKVAQHALLPLLSHLSKESSGVDLQDVLMRYMFDISVDIIFGKQSNYLSTSFPPNEFAKAMDDASEAILYRHVVPISWWKLSRRLKIGSNEKKLEEAGTIIDRHIAEYIKVKRQQIGSKGTKVDEYEENDLLGVYMSIKDGEKDELMLAKMLTDKFFRDTCITFLIAARDTTASTLSWFFWMILKNPSVEAKILEELELIISKKNTTEKHPVIFDADDQAGMVYIHAALCESLRLYPAVPLLRKTSTSDDVLPDGTVIWPGMTVIISCYAMGRMEWVWGKDCLEFKPERWISEDGKLNPEALSKLVSFSLGPRNCIGKDMAFVLMKLVASAVIYNYHVELLEGQNIVPAAAITLKMMNGLMVRVRERVFP